MSFYWLGIPLCAGFAVLAFLMIRMRQDLRRSIAQVSQVIELLPATHESQSKEAPPDGWPPHTALQANSPVPPELLSRMDGGWALAVFGRDAAEVNAVLPQGEDLGRLTSRYSLLAAVPQGSAPGTAGEIDLVPIPEQILDGAPLPAVGMVDPEGVIQGVGAVVNDFDLLAFVHEGEHHGFGPSADAEHPADHHHEYAH